MASPRSLCRGRKRKCQREIRTKKARGGSAGVPAITLRDSCFRSGAQLSTNYWPMLVADALMPCWSWSGPMQSTPIAYSFRQLWDQIGPPRRLLAANAAFDSPIDEDTRLLALNLLGEQFKIRRKSLLAWPVDKKAGRLASVHLPDEQLARGLVKQYYFSTQQPMMSRFLDLVHVTHDNGCYSDEPTPKDAAELSVAASTLSQEFDTDEARLYLNALYLNNPEVWAGLRANAACRSREYGQAG